MWSFFNIYIFLPRNVQQNKFLHLYVEFLFDMITYCTKKKYKLHFYGLLWRTAVYVNLSFFNCGSTFNRQKWEWYQSSYLILGKNESTNIPENEKNI